MALVQLPAPGAMTLIATATPSAASTVSFASIPTFYKILIVKFVGHQSDTSNIFGVRLNNQSSGHSWIAGTFSASATGSSSGTGGDSMFANSTTYGVVPACGSADNADKAQGFFYVYDANLVQTNHQCSWQAGGRGGTARNTFGFGYVDLTTAAAISQIDFVRNSTNTITGTFYLYGVN